MSPNLIFHRIGASAGLLTAGVARAQEAGGGSALRKKDCVKLLQKLGDSDCITIKPGAETFVLYFNEAVPFIFRVAIGACIVWVLIAGFGIMVTGGDAGKRGEWLERFKWAIGGLLMLLFAGFLLRTLNALFFT